MESVIINTNDLKCKKRKLIHNIDKFIRIRF